MSSEPRDPEATAIVSGDDKPLAIELGGLGKCYHMYEKPADRLWQALFRRKGSHKEFWALRGVDLQVRRGETFGIIGRNGSGKSTLLQMVAGTLMPTEGTLRVSGRVAALLELGSGFNPEFTGRENVYLNATILGLTRKQIDERMEDILAFADIGEFVDEPVRSYSSGMAVRLAFAVIVHVDADVLIVDEALSVGDAFFSQKCMRFLRDFQKRGTLLFVSHDAAAVTNLCDRALWLEHGQARMVGDARTVVENYMAQQHARGREAAAGDKVVVEYSDPKILNDDPPDFRHDDYQANHANGRFAFFEFDLGNTGVQFGTGQVSIERVALLDAGTGEPLELAAGGELVRLRISFRLVTDIDGLIAGFYVKDRLGQQLFGDNTYFRYRDAPVSAHAGEVMHADFVFRLPIMPTGSYMLDVAVAAGSQEDHTQLHWMYDALEFKALDETMRHGLVGIPMRSIVMSKDVEQ